MLPKQREIKEKGAVFKFPYFYRNVTFFIQTAPMASFF